MSYYEQKEHEAREKLLESLPALAIERDRANAEEQLAERKLFETRGACLEAAKRKKKSKKVWEKLEAVEKAAFAVLEEKKSEAERARMLWQNAEHLSHVKMCKLGLEAFAAGDKNYEVINLKRQRDELLQERDQLLRERGVEWVDMMDMSKIRGASDYMTKLMKELDDEDLAISKRCKRLRKEIDELAEQVEYLNEEDEEL
jgi:hypothetical protein